MVWTMPPPSVAQPLENQADKEIIGSQTDTAAIATVTVKAGQHARKNAIATTPFNVFDADLKTVTLVDQAGNRLIGQIAETSRFEAQENAKKTLTFIVPDLAKDESRTYQVFGSDLSPTPAFNWHNDGSQQSELQFGSDSVVRYMYEALDDATPERREVTYKPYHHVFSPDGKTLLTKGPGGLYTHHRGIYFGFNRISYDGKQADTWHCRNGESQRQSADCINLAGPVFGARYQFHYLARSRLIAVYR